MSGLLDDEIRCVAKIDSDKEVFHCHCVTQSLSPGSLESEQKMKALQINLHTKINSLGESGEIANGPKSDDNRTIFGAVFDTTAPENANDAALKKWKGLKEGRWLAVISGSKDPVLIAVADDHDTLLAELNRLHSTDDLADKEAADESNDKP
jgi:hypothetical protein